MTCFFFNPALPLSSGSQTMVGVRITGALGKDAQALACLGSLGPCFLSAFLVPVTLLWWGAMWEYRCWPPLSS